MWDAAMDQQAQNHQQEELRLLGEAQTIADASGDPQLRLKTMRKRSELLHQQGELDKEIDVRFDTVSLLKEQGSLVELAREYADLSDAVARTAHGHDQLRMAKKAVEALSQAKVDDQPLKADLLRRLAQAELSENDPSSAVKHLQQVESLHAKLYGDDDVQTLFDRDELARAYSKSGQNARAAKMLKQSLATREQLFQPEDTSIWKVLSQYREVVQKLDDKKEFARIQRKIDAYLDNYRPDSPVGLKSGAPVNVHGYVPPPPPDAFGTTISGPEN